MKTTINGFQDPKTHLYGPFPVDTINLTGGHFGFAQNGGPRGPRRPQIDKTTS